MYQWSFYSCQIHFSHIIYNNLELYTPVEIVLMTPVFKALWGGGGVVPEESTYKMWGGRFYG